jgi:signal transduction histidine kinase
MCRVCLRHSGYVALGDLRAPLRAIDGFSAMLLEEYGADLDKRASQCLNRVGEGTQRMSALTEDLLNLSRIARAPLQRASFDLTEL